MDAERMRDPSASRTPRPVARGMVATATWFAGMRPEPGSVSSQAAASSSGDPGTDSIPWATWSIVANSPGGTVDGSAADPVTTSGTCGGSIDDGGRSCRFRDLDLEPPDVTTSEEEVDPILPRPPGRRGRIGYGRHEDQPALRRHPGDGLRVDPIERSRGRPPPDTDVEWSMPGRVGDPQADHRPNVRLEDGLGVVAGRLPDRRPTLAEGTSGVSRLRAGRAQDRLDPPSVAGLDEGFDIAPSQGASERRFGGQRSIGPGRCRGIDSRVRRRRSDLRHVAAWPSPRLDDGHGQGDDDQGHAQDGRIDPPSAAPKRHWLEFDGLAWIHPGHLVIVARARAGRIARLGRP